MREIHCQQITDAVARLSVEACYHLPEDILAALRSAADTERSEIGRSVLRQILENAEIASHGQFPLCQDTGHTVVFVDLGQDVHLVGGSLVQCIAEGVRRGYRQGFLRMSIVDQPGSARTNTGDNAPPVIHVRVVPGQELKLTVMPKGGGSENMSRLRMMAPAEGRRGIVDFVVQSVDQAGANPCPPILVGVGIGGTAEHAMLLAKEALLRTVGQPSADPDDASLEVELLRRINALGIGPQGLGGDVTALAVHVHSEPCHIGSLPVAVNLQCHSARHVAAIL
jgi:fumarate hydratase subunit alpha